MLRTVIYKIELVLIILPFLFSCNQFQVDKAPKCNDSKVIEMALAQFKKEAKNVWLESKVEDNMDDIRSYAYDHTSNDNDAKKMIEEEINRFRNHLSDEVDSILYPTRIINITTEQINKDISKCNCSGEIENPNLNSINISYTAQKAYESEDGIIVKIKYSVKDNQK